MVPSVSHETRGSLTALCRGQGACTVPSVAPGPSPSPQPPNLIPQFAAASLPLHSPTGTSSPISTRLTLAPIHCPPGKPQEVGSGFGLEKPAHIAGKAAACDAGIAHRCWTAVLTAPLLRPGEAVEDGPVPQAPAPTCKTWRKLLALARTNVGCWSNIGPIHLGSEPVDARSPFLQLLQINKHLKKHTHLFQPPSSWVTAPRIHQRGQEACSVAADEIKCSGTVWKRS